MPVDIPNPREHKLCYRCGRWHEEHEGSFEPAKSGPGALAGARALSERLAGLDPTMRFVCDRCRARRQWMPMLWIAVILVLVGFFVALIALSLD